MLLRKFKFAPIAALSLASTIAVGPYSQVSDQQTKRLAEEFIAAVNTKNEATLLAFLEKNATSTPPAKDRVGRIRNALSEGAPFKIGKFISTSPSEAVFTATDAEGVELQFTINFVGTPPKLSRLMARPAGEDGRPAKTYVNWKSLTDLVSQIRKDENAPAIGAAIIHDGKLEVAVDGVRELGKSEPVTKSDIWSVGSIGKPLCATVLAKLVEQGKLRWDQTLKESLPGIPMKPAYEGVTLQQLAQHRGGIPEDGGMTFQVVQRIVGDAKSQDAIRTNYAKDILGRDPIAPAGMEFHYSNAGFALLAKVIETVEKEPYEKVLRKIIFLPLGLKDSYVGSDTYPETYPSGHVPGPNGPRPMNLRGQIETLFVGAGGGIMMSVADLATFGAVHLKGLRGEDGFLKSSTVKKMHEGISADGGPNFSYGMGFGIERDPGLPVRYGHNGSNGTFRAQLAIYPELNLVAVGIVNAGGEREPAPGLTLVRNVAKRYTK